MTVIYLTVIILTLKGVAPQGSFFYEEEDWQDYMAGQVELDDYDRDKAYTAVDDTAKVIESVTVHVDQPKAYRIEQTGQAPFASIIYPASMLPSAPGGNYRKLTAACGAAMLTRYVVLTLCACVHTFLWTLDKVESRPPEEPLNGNVPPHPHDADLGKSPLYLSPDGEHFFDGDSSPGGYSEHKIQFDPSHRGNPQYRNSNCVKMMRIHGSRAQTKELAGIMVVLRFEPAFITPIADWFAPWPPVLIPYDSPLQSKSRYNDALSSVRYQQAVTISSYAFKQWKNASRYRTQDGALVDVFHSLINFRTTLCQQAHCKSASDLLPLYDKGRSYYIMDPSSLGCFCDANHDTLCGGIIGSPAVHEGLLYGLLAEKVPCDNNVPRSVLIRGFDTYSVENISDAVPDLRWTAEGLEMQYRANSSLEMDYNVFFPGPGMLPDVDKNLEITLDQVGEPHSRSSCDTYTLFLLKGVVLMSIVFLAHHF